MKHKFSLLILLIIQLLSLRAQEVKEISLTFNEEDYEYVSIGKDSVLITTKLNFIYKEDSLSPGLPVVPVRILVSSDCSCSDLSFSVSKHLAKENIYISHNPIPVTTNNFEEGKYQPVTYADKIFPDANVEYVGMDVSGRNKILSFLVCPFVYDAKTKSLYFIDSMDLSVSLNKAATVAKSYGTQANSMIGSLAINVDDIVNDEMIEEGLGDVDESNAVDYIIVTSDSLKTAFQPLVDWKRMKGVRTEIITTEFIDTVFAGESMQVKIKSCLYENYKNRGLKYVMLGGDDTVVPTRKCYVYVSGKNNDSIPADLYYACFDGNFEWDANNNGIFGEVADKISMIPSVYVTRLPAKEAVHVDNFIYKMLEYEKNPDIDNWTNEMLMCGVSIERNMTKTPSDAEQKGDNLYNNYISPYWNGTRKRLYDTRTDFEGNADYEFNPTNFQQQLQSGYPFIDIISHGCQNAIETKKWGVYYCSYIPKLTNKTNNTIITTIACLTNCFDYIERECYSADDSEPCVSESFIREKGSGVIAYLGSSREGWTYSGTGSLGPSMQYDAQFYKKLFAPDLKNKNFGLIAAAAKMEKITESQYDKCCRWVQFGLNPVGDPEMPIYTTTPMSFTDAAVLLKDGTLTVTTGTDSCRVCVMSADDNGNTYYKVVNNINSVSLPDINANVTVCITKQNYVPLVKNIDFDIYIQNETINDSRTYRGNIIKVGANVTTAKPQGDVTFKNGITTLKGKKIVIENGTTVRKEAGLKLYNK